LAFDLGEKRNMGVQAAMALSPDHPTLSST